MPMPHSRVPSQLANRRSGLDSDVINSNHKVMALSLLHLVRRMTHDRSMSA
jgi:hypothetical protein